MGLVYQQSVKDKKYVRVFCSAGLPTLVDVFDLIVDSAGRNILFICLQALKMKNQTVVNYFKR